MISAQTIKGVEALLGQHGVQMKTDEPFGDVVARELGITGAQAETLLATLHDGGTVEAALRAAHVESIRRPHSEFLNNLARVIGSVLGQVAGFGNGQHEQPDQTPAKLPQPNAGELPGHLTDPTLGATEDQVNLRATVPPRIDSHGSKVEELAGTGEIDAAGG